MPGLDVEKLVRLNQVLGVNLKPNEDGDYAEEPFMPMSPMEALRTGRRCSKISPPRFGVLIFRKLSSERLRDDRIQ